MTGNKIDPQVDVRAVAKAVSVKEKLIQLMKDNNKALSEADFKQYEENVRREKMREAIEHAKSRIVSKDKDGNVVYDWDKAIQEATRLAEAEVTSYNDWRNAMMSILAMFSLMVTAMHNDRLLGQAGTAILNKLPTVKALLEFASQKMTEAWWNSCKAKYPEDLPTLTYQVKWDDKKGLDIYLSCANGMPIKEELNNDFKDLVSLWLTTTTPSYVPGSPNPEILIDSSTNKPLTQEDLTQLIDKHGASFSSFLEKHSTLKFSDELDLGHGAAPAA